MTSKLFAFRVARPIEDSGDTPFEFSYDPQSQTSVWNGSGNAAAYYHCTSGGKQGNCHAYGYYCTTSGGGSQKCDT
jgi:hypothetical protein